MVDRGPEAFRYRFFGEKTPRPRRGGSGWDGAWGPLRSPFVRWWQATRATTRVNTSHLRTSSYL